MVTPTTSYNGLTIAYVKGRGTGMSNAAGAQAWSYDRLGRLLCNGAMIVSTALAGQPVTVNAYGSPDYDVYPNMQVWVNGTQVGQWTVTGAAQNYTASANVSGITTTYHHADHLSVRVTTDTNGNIANQRGHYPFGETWYEAGAAEKWKFTSYERDSETLNDYAMARFYLNRYGRFLSPDPIAGVIANPQSLNRYAYALNMPVNLTDPLGLSPEDAEWPVIPYEADNALNTWGSTNCVVCQFNWFMLTAWHYNQAKFQITAKNASTSGKNQEAIDQVLALLREMLGGDPDCVGFLSRLDPESGHVVNPLGLISSHLDVYSTIGHAGLFVNGNPAPTLNGISGAGNVEPGYSILVNTSGAFYNSNGSAGGYRGATPAARGFIMLHEFGHVSKVLKPDLGDPKAGRSNDAAVKANCKKTLATLGKMK